MNNYIIIIMFIIIIVIILIIFNFKNYFKKIDDTVDIRDENNNRIYIRYNINIRDENDNIINTNYFEKPEKDLVYKYIKSNDTVLELGARYGSVSCIINSKLKNKMNQVSVEPDDTIWEALENNKKRNNCEFNIVKGFVSNKKLDLIKKKAFGMVDLSYGTTSIESDNTSIKSFSLDEIQNKYNIKFNVLVADCEGFLETFLDENPTIYDNLRLIIFEADYPDKCNYDKIKNNLISKKFISKENGFQNVWIKN